MSLSDRDFKPIVLVSIIAAELFAVEKPSRLDPMHYLLRWCSEKKKLKMIAWRPSSKRCGDLKPQIIGRPKSAWSSVRL